MLKVARFLERVYRRSSTDEHAAVDAVYDFMDDCLLEGDFSACDAALEGAVPERFPLSVIISFLIVTARAAKWLHERDSFYSRAAATVKRRDGAEAAQALRKYQ
jgi:hypothetical protein